MSDLNTQLEEIRQHMVAGTYGLQGKLKALEDIIEAERAGALRHIAAISDRYDVAKSEIASELERLRAKLLNQSPVHQAPHIEERYTAQRLNGFAHADQYDEYR